LACNILVVCFVFLLYFICQSTVSHLSLVQERPQWRSLTSIFIFLVLIKTFLFLLVIQ
jgi:hypothetical protein